MSSKRHEQVNEFFDGYSEKWDSLYGKERKKDPLSKFADEVLRAVIKRRLSTTLGFTKSDKIKTVLDAGCGSGQYVVEFASAQKASKHVFCHRLFFLIPSGLYSGIRSSSSGPSIR